MNKSELKKVLKPLIKECIKEVIFEDGTLSSIIAEVMRGTGTTQPIVESKKSGEPSLTGGVILSLCLCFQLLLMFF